MNADFLVALARRVESRAGPLDRIQGDLRRLHEGFTDQRGGRPPDYLKAPGARRAYLASLMVPNATRALHVIRRAGGGLGPGERALDVGAGTGAAALALAAVSHPKSEIVLVDRSGPALGEARALFRDLFPGGPRIAPVRADLGRGATGLPEGPFDVVVAGHLLNELLPPRGRGPGPVLGFSKALAGRVGDRGRLVLVEPAQRIPSRMLGRIRKDLVRAGWRPLGPCTHAGHCPVLAGGARDWCVTDVPFSRPRVVAAVDRMLGMNRTKLSVAWLVLTRVPAPAGPRTYEVLSHPMRGASGFVVYLCGERGRLVANLPLPPRPPHRRGEWVQLPDDAKPAGRDRSGAPLIAVDRLHPA